MSNVIGFFSVRHLGVDPAEPAQRLRRERRVSSQPSNVLTDVVIARAAPELVDVLLVVRERHSGRSCPARAVQAACCMHRGAFALDL